MRCCMILKFPEGGDNALRACLDERVNDTRYAFFSDWPTPVLQAESVTKLALRWRFLDLPYLEQTVVCGLRLWSEDESGAIWNLRINISMEGQVDHAVMAERELLEVWSPWRWHPGERCLAWAGRRQSLSTSWRLSGRATSSLLSGPETAR